MKIEFLQVDEDIDEFVDFLYDSGFFISRSTGIRKEIAMDSQTAKEVLRIDLLVNSRNYYIGAGMNIVLMELVSCGPNSHPRFTNRRGRETGMLCSNDDICDIQFSDSIKKYFRRKYKRERYHDTAKFRCWFGPNYQRLNSTYLQVPESNNICHGYVRLTCAQEFAETACDILRKMLSTHPELSSTEILQRRWGDKADETDIFMGLLLDRSKYGIEYIVQIAKELAFPESRIRVVREKNYEAVFSTWDKKEDYTAKWNVRISVDQEWKGFGIFCTPSTWLV